MPRRTFSAGTVTNTTGAPLRLTFHATSTTGRRETDLWTVDGSSNPAERIPNGVILTDASGAYSAFAGPDDLDALYLQVGSSSGSRTQLAAAGYVASSGLPGTYGRVAGARPGNRMVWFGDSLTQWQDSVAANNAPTSTISHSQRVSLGNLGSILSNQQARYVTNAGVGGNTTGDMLARFDTDVTPYKPTVVHILGGTNDPSGTLTTYTLPNLAAIVAKVWAIGAVPILGLIPPNSTTTKSEQFNQGITRLAASLGVAVIDYCAPLVDPATGSFLSAYVRGGDTTHPNDAGFMLMGQAFATAFAKIAPPLTPILPQRNTGTNNLIANGLFLNPGAPTFPSSWSGGTGTGITTTTEATGAAFGNWVKVDAAAAAGNAQLFQNVATAPVAGHRYALLGKIKTSWTSGNGFQIRNRITLGDASTVDMMPLNNMGVTIPDGTFYCEYTCPANAASQQVSLFVLAGTGTLWVSQMALWDLTALGLDAL